jgi:hypothetical protein
MIYLLCNDESAVFIGVVEVVEVAVVLVVVYVSLILP